MSGLKEKDLNVAITGASQFVSIFYDAYDSKDRIRRLPKLYRKDSSVVWNGTPAQGDSGVKELMEKMPSTKHEVQTFDCHPIPRTFPPSLLITVNGVVIHGKTARNTHPTSSKAVDDQPRIFSQTFILVPELERNEGNADLSSGMMNYYILSDSMRFVG